MSDIVEDIVFIRLLFISCVFKDNSMVLRLSTFCFCNVFVIARKLFEKTIYKQNDLEIKWNVLNLFSVQVENK